MERERREREGVEELVAYEAKIDGVI